MQRCLRIDFMSTSIWLSGYNNTLIADVQEMIKGNLNGIFSEHLIHRVRQETITSWCINMYA